MPRNASGVFILLPTNPVIPGSVIATSWANPTMADLADGLTNSLDRTGLGGMTAPFRIFDGTISAPGLAYTNEVTLGIYRPSSATMGFVSGGISYFQVGPNGVTSQVKLIHRGIDIWPLSGNFTWKAENILGTYTLTPSIAADDTTNFDASNAFKIASDGSATINGNLAVSGAITAGSWTFTSILASGTITSSTGLVAPSVKVDQNIINALTQAGPTDINFALSQSWIVPLSATLTINSLSGLALGNIGRITFTSTSFTVNLPATVKWPGPTFAKPDFTAGPLKRVIMVVEYDGTNFLANASVY